MLLILAVFEWEWLAIIFDIYHLCSFIIWHGDFIIYFITLFREKSAMEMFQTNIKNLPNTCIAIVVCFFAPRKCFTYALMRPPPNASSSPTAQVVCLLLFSTGAQRFNLNHKHRYTQCLLCMDGGDYYIQHYNISHQLLTHALTALCSFHFVSRFCFLKVGMCMFS